MITSHFETDAGDGSRDSEFSKERRLEPPDRTRVADRRVGFPIDGRGFRGKRGRDQAILPVLQCFRAVHQLIDVTIVADAGVISDAG
jgi:hypothetical protein